MEPIVKAPESFLSKSFTCTHLKQFKDSSSFDLKIHKKYINFLENLNLNLKNYGSHYFETKTKLKLKQSTYSFNYINIHINQHAWFLISIAVLQLEHL